MRSAEGPRLSAHRSGEQHAVPHPSVQACFVNCLSLRPSISLEFMLGVGMPASGLIPHEGEQEGLWLVLGT